MAIRYLGIGCGGHPMTPEILHQHIAKVMRMYGGTLGRIRVVEAKMAKCLGMHGQPYEPYCSGFGDWFCWLVGIYYSLDRYKL